MVVHLAKAKLDISKPLLRRPAVPLGCFGVILRHDALMTPVVHVTEESLGKSMPLLSGAVKPYESPKVIL
jgi:hypothetical protein